LKFAIPGEVTLGAQPGTIKHFGNGYLSAITLRIRAAEDLDHEFGHSVRLFAGCQCLRLGILRRLTLLFRFLTQLRFAFGCRFGQLLLLAR
jgi:hypothetical protein